MSGTTATNPNLVSSEISDFTTMYCRCTHGQSNIVHTKYADKTDD